MLKGETFKRLGKLFSLLGTFQLRFQNQKCGFNLQLPGIEGVALVAGFEIYRSAFGAQYGEGVTATAYEGGGFQFRMYSLFHLILLLSKLLFNANSFILSQRAVCLFVESRPLQMAGYIQLVKGCSILLKFDYRVARVIASETPKLLEG